MEKTPEFEATYDPVVSHQKVWEKLQNLTHHMTIVTKSKGMQKSPEFDATYDPVVIKSKSMEK